MVPFDRFYCPVNDKPAPSVPAASTATAEEPLVATFCIGLARCTASVLGAGSAGAGEATPGGEVEAAMVRAPLDSLRNAFDRWNAAEGGIREGPGSTVGKGSRGRENAGKGHRRGCAEYGEAAQLDIACLRHIGCVCAWALGV